jgi:uncharacterized protein (DUF1501 family)
MLSLLDRGTPLCDGITRREWLRIGAVGAFGLTLPGLLAAREATPARKTRSCIVLFLLGAPPQQETWDPKPDSPTEARGDLKPIQSATPGFLVGELMPKTARLTEKIAVLRAVQTNDNAHSSSAYYMTTGHPHQPMGAENAKPGAPNDWPALGAIVKKLADGSGPLPAAITLPEQAANDGNLTWPGQDAGFLGRSADPWLLNCDPSASQFRIPGLSLPDEVPALRFDARRSLLEQVDHHLGAVERSGLPALHGSRTQQAFDMIRSAAACKALNLDSEDPKLRDRYGRHRFGQSVLLARRLVEAGVPLVRVNWTRVPGALNNGHWDTHSQNTKALKQLMPMLDQTYATLLEDLADRGLLDDTLVVWTGEFGRTPKLNGGGGRDHWGQVFSVALAGGGIRGGTVYGASDKIAGYPRDGRVLPQDLHATILEAMGIPPSSEIHDSLGRPLPATRGQVIRAIL